MEKSLLLEKLVQDKINYSNCIYILLREYMCLWLQAARAMPLNPPDHVVLHACKVLDSP